MTIRENTLKNILHRLYRNGTHTKPYQDDFYRSIHNEEIDNVYRILGGKQNKYPTNYRGYDIICKNFILELDEERHFNRYRLLTLNSNIYNNKKYFDYELYRIYCKDKEYECKIAASWGRNWKTDSSDKQFGESNIEGCLESNGSSRWKQRAFYDYLRDISFYISGIPIIRVSIWEKMDEGNIIDNILSCKNNMLIEKYFRKIIDRYIR